MSRPAERRQLSGRAVLVVLALLVTVALAVNWYNNRETDRNVDRQTEEFIEACELEGTC